MSPTPAGDRPRDDPHPSGRASGKRNPPAESVDEYLARVPEEPRAALERLRGIIRATVPNAVEVVSYQIPAYRYGGLLVGFAAAQDHCTFHLMSTGVMRTHSVELRGYDVGKGSIRFRPGEPLPEALVKKLIRARVAENERRAKAKRGRRASPP